MIRTNARRLTAVPALPRPRNFIFLPYFHIQYTSSKPRALSGRRWEWQYEQRDGAISERCTRSEYVSGRGWVDVEVKVRAPKETKQEEFDIDLITMRRVRKPPAGAARTEAPAADAPAAEPPKPAPTPTPTPTPTPKPDQSKSKSTPDTPHTSPTPRLAAAEAPPAAVEQDLPGGAVEHGDTKLGNTSANDPRVAESPSAAVVEKVADTAAPAEPLEIQPTPVEQPAESLAGEQPTEASLGSAPAVAPESADQVVVQNLPAEPTMVLEPRTPAEPLAGEHPTAPAESVDQVADTAVQDLLESQPAIILPGPRTPVAVELQTPVDQPATADVQIEPMHPSTDAEAPVVVVATAPVLNTPAVADEPDEDLDLDLDLLRPSDVRAAAGAPGKPTRRIEGDAEKARRRAQMLAEFEAAEAEKERDNLGGTKAPEENTGSKMQQLGGGEPTTHAEPTTPIPEEPHKYFVLICNPDSADMQLSALPDGVSVRETTAFDSLQMLRSPERFLPLWHVLQKGGFMVVGGEGDCLVLKVGAEVATEKRELVLREIRGRTPTAEVVIPAEVAVPEQQELVKERQELVKEQQELVRERQELIKEQQEFVKESQQELVKESQQQEPQEQQKQKPKTRPFRRVFWTAVWVAACSGVVSVGLEEYL